MSRWKLFLAFFRLSKTAVCEMSTPERDFHDYADGNSFEPVGKKAIHFWTYQCVRCGKAFQI